MKGVVKSLHPHDLRYVYVTLRICSMRDDVQDWVDNYQKYPAQRVLVKQLKIGW